MGVIRTKLPHMQRDHCISGSKFQEHLMPPTEYNGCSAVCEGVCLVEREVGASERFRVVCSLWFLFGALMSLQGSSNCLIKGGVPVTVVTSNYPENHATCSLMSVGLIVFANRMRFRELTEGPWNSWFCLPLLEVSRAA